MRRWIGSRSVVGRDACRKEYLMRHNGVLFAAVVVAVAAFLLSAAIASAGSKHGERPLRVGEGQGGRHGYGFLPGYDPPQTAESPNPPPPPPTLRSVLPPF